MKISNIIERLREILPAQFSDRIAGAADLEEAMKNGNMTAPCLYVSLSPTTVTDVSQVGTNYIEQEVEELITIFVHIDNTTDRRGQSAQEAVHAFRNALWSALIFWNADLDGSNSWGYKTMEFMYDGDTVAAITTERYYHAFRFRHTFKINNLCEGIGNMMPDDAGALVDLLKIYGDIKPTEVTASENPALQTQVDY